MVKGVAARLGHALAQNMAAPRRCGPVGCRMASVRAGPSDGFLLGDRP
jgi:hypothetical protein